jgi:hypothetical protein
MELDNVFSEAGGFEPNIAAKEVACQSNISFRLCVVELTKKNKIKKLQKRDTPPPHTHIVKCDPIFCLLEL